MKLKNITEVNEFIGIIAKCDGDVWVESAGGDRFNLKSTLSQYIAIGRLINERGEGLELFCSNRKDEGMFLEYFRKYPDTV